MGKTSVKAVNKYIKKAYDRINLIMPKGKKEVIKTAAASAGLSQNAYIMAAIDEKMERERG